MNKIYGDSNIFALLGLVGTNFECQLALGEEERRNTKCKKRYWQVPTCLVLEWPSTLARLGRWLGHGPKESSTSCLRVI